MSETERNENHVRCLGVRLSGDDIGEVDEDGTPIVGETILYLLNAADTITPFVLPSFVHRPRWETILDTFDLHRVGGVHDGATSYALAPHSLAVFIMRLREAGQP
jgi:glycogen operon protein